MNKEKLGLYKIDPDYLRYMHAADHRVSVKYNNRPFVGVITMINGIKYVIPLTSKTTEKRRTEGKKKRPKVFTTYIRDRKGKEIANLLHNNMFPVVEGTYTLWDIDPEKNTYESNEIRYIRKHSKEIVDKAKRVYNYRIENKNAFVVKICCDYKTLESASSKYEVHP